MRSRRELGRHPIHVLDGAERNQHVARLIRVDAVFRRAGYPGGFLLFQMFDQPALEVLLQGPPPFPPEV